MKIRARRTDKSIVVASLGGNAARDRARFLRQNPDQRKAQRDFSFDGVPNVGKDVVFFPHQAKALSALSDPNRPRDSQGVDVFILDADMGAGKTPMLLFDALRCMADGKCRKPLIVMPGNSGVLPAQQKEEIMSYTDNTVNVVIVTSETVGSKMEKFEPERDGTYRARGRSSKGNEIPDWDEEALFDLIAKAPPNTIFVSTYSFMQAVTRGSRITLGEATAEMDVEGFLTVKEAKDLAERQGGVSVGRRKVAKGAKGAEKIGIAQGRRPLRFSVRYNPKSVFGSLSQAKRRFPGFPFDDPKAAWEIQKQSYSFCKWLSTHPDVTGSGRNSTIPVEWLWDGTPDEKRDRRYDELLYSAVHDMPTFYRDDSGKLRKQRKSKDDPEPIWIVQLTRPFDFLDAGIDYVALDESQQIKNKSSRTAVMNVLGHDPRIRVKRLASGTLMPKEPMDLWQQLNWLMPIRDVEGNVIMDESGFPVGNMLLGTSDAFTRTYTHGGVWKENMPYEVFNEETGEWDIEFGHALKAIRAKLSGRTTLLDESGMPVKDENGEDVKFGPVGMSIRREAWGHMLPRKIEDVKFVPLNELLQSIHDNMFTAVLAGGVLDEIKQLDTELADALGSEGDDPEVFKKLQILEQIVTAPDASDTAEQIGKILAEVRKSNSRLFNDLLRQMGMSSTSELFSALGGMVSPKMAVIDDIIDRHLQKKFSLAVLDEDGNEVTRVNRETGEEEVVKKDQVGKIIVFCNHHAVAEHLYNHSRHRSIATKYSAREKAALARFKSNPNVKVLFAISHSLRVGHNLQMANCVITVSLPWNTGDLDQMLARTFRPKQRMDVFVHHILATGALLRGVDQRPGTIDLLKYARMIARKYQILMVNSEADKDELVKQEIPWPSVRADSMIEKFRNEKDMQPYVETHRAILEWEERRSEEMAPYYGKEMYDLNRGDKLPGFPIRVPTASTVGDVYSGLEPWNVKAKKAGRVVSVTSDSIVVEYKGGKTESFDITKTVEVRNGGEKEVPTHSPVVLEGETFRKGDILARGAVDLTGKVPFEDDNGRFAPFRGYEKDWNRVLELSNEAGDGPAYDNRGTPLEGDRWASLSPEAQAERMRKQRLIDPLRESDGQPDEEWGYRTAEDPEDFWLSGTFIGFDYKPDGQVVAILEDYSFYHRVEVPIEFCKPFRAQALPAGTRVRFDYKKFLEDGKRFDSVVDMPTSDDVWEKFANDMVVLGWKMTATSTEERVEYSDLAWRSDRNSNRSRYTRRISVNRQPVYTLRGLVEDPVDEITGDRHRLPNLRKMSSTLPSTTLDTPNSIPNTSTIKASEYYVLQPEDPDKAFAMVDNVPLRYLEILSSRQELEALDFVDRQQPDERLRVLTKRPDWHAMCKAARSKQASRAQREMERQLANLSLWPNVEEPMSDAELSRLLIDHASRDLDPILPWMDVSVIDSLEGLVIPPREEKAQNKIEGRPKDFDSRISLHTTARQARTSLNWNVLGSHKGSLAARIDGSKMPSFINGVYGPSVKMDAFFVATKVKESWQFFVLKFGAVLADTKSGRSIKGVDLWRVYPEIDQLASGSEENPPFVTSGRARHAGMISGLTVSAFKDNVKKGLLPWGKKLTPKFIPESLAPVDQSVGEQLGGKPRTTLDFNLIHDGRQVYH